DVPNLIDIQRKSFEWLTDPENGGLRETIDDISPIEDYTGHLAVNFGEFHFDEPAASIDECREKDLTYSRPLTVTVAFINHETGAGADGTAEDIERLDQELLDLFDKSLYVRNTIDADPENTKTKKGALIELFKKQRPGEPPSVDAAYSLLQQLFFDPKRYDLTHVGRYKLNSRLSLDIDLDTRVLTHDDLHALVKALVPLPKLLGMPEELDAEIKDYAAEAITMPREPIQDHLDEYEH